MTSPFGFATPMIYVDSAAKWHYKIEVTAGEISAETLTALGNDEWELTAILPKEDKVIYYFKRFGR